MTKFCPCCGFDLVVDKRVVRGALLFDPRGRVVFHGNRLKLSPAIHILLGTLLKANGEFVTTATLKERVDSDVDGNTIQVYVCRLRKLLSRIEPGVQHIETAKGRGYRWAA